MVSTKPFEGERILLCDWKLPSLAKRAKLNLVAAIVIAAMGLGTLFVFFSGVNFPSLGWTVIQLLAGVLGLGLIYSFRSVGRAMEAEIEELVNGSSVWLAQERLLRNDETPAIDPISLRIRLSSGEWVSFWEIEGSEDLLGLVPYTETSQLYLVRVVAEGEQGKGQQDRPNSKDSKLEDGSL